MAFMADLMGPICQNSPGTFFESLESCSQLASTGAQTSFQMGKLTPFPSRHSEGEGITFLKLMAFFEVLFIYVKCSVSYLINPLH
jgi:hypothetical protein